MAPRGVTRGLKSGRAASDAEACRPLPLEAVRQDGGGVLRAEIQPAERALRMPMLEAPRGTPEAAAPCRNSADGVACLKRVGGVTITRPGSTRCFSNGISLLSGQLLRPGVAATQGTDSKKSARAHGSCSLCCSRSAHRIFKPAKPASSFERRGVQDRSAALVLESVPITLQCRLGVVMPGVAVEPPLPRGVMHFGMRDGDSPCEALGGVLCRCCLGVDGGVGLGILDSTKQVPPAMVATH